jgi:hypothetical protein
MATVPTDVVGSTLRKKKKEICFGKEDERKLFHNIQYYERNFLKQQK